MVTRALALERARARNPASILTGSFVVGLLRLLDLTLIAVSGLLAYLLYLYPRQEGVNSRYMAAIAVGVFVAASLAQWFRAYEGRDQFLHKLSLRRILAAWAVAFAVLLLAAFSLKISALFSRVWAGSWLVTSVFLLIAGRALFDAWLRRLAEDGRLANRTVIVGAGELGQRLVARLTEDGNGFTRILGFIDDRRSRLADNLSGFARLGDIDELARLVRCEGVDQVIVALPWSAVDRLRDLVQRLAVMPVRLRLAPDRAGFEFPDRNFSSLGGIPLLNLFDRPISGWAQVTKVVEDRVLATLLLLAFAPFMALIALAIRIESPGPVWFRQARYGFNNKLIEVWKFRSMYHGMADPRAEVLTCRGDPRVTRVGRFLRRASLDELPQLLNVLRGDMSIVGPRPHATAAKAAGHRYEEAVEAYAARHKVKPGITGWAQVNGWRGETDTLEKIRKRVEYDMHYIENWSLWFDLEIILRTGLLLLKDDRAY